MSLQQPLAPSPSGSSSSSCSFRSTPLLLLPHRRPTLRQRLPPSYISSLDHQQRSSSSSSSSAAAFRRFLSPSFRTRWTNLLFYAVATVSVLTVSSIGMSSNTLPCPARPGLAGIGLEGSAPGWETGASSRSILEEEERKKRKKIRNRRWLEDPFVAKPPTKVPKASAREDSVLRSKTAVSSRRVTDRSKTEIVEEGSLSSKAVSWSDWLRTSLG